MSKRILALCMIVLSPAIFVAMKGGEVVKNELANGSR